MKRSLTLLTLSFAFAKIASVQDFYDINTINTIEIVFTQPNWNEILDSLYATGEGRLAGTVFINGQQLDSAGVRYKGNSSYQYQMVKKPLNIKLDYIIPDQNIDGYGTIKLSNGFKDPSLVRETLGYEIARNYMPASNANYAKVYINGGYIGLYTSVQDVDRNFAQTHFLSNENAFFKGEINGNLQGFNGAWNYFGQDSSLYYDRYTIESDHGWADLTGFLDTLNNHSGFMDEVLNVDRHFWMLAYDILLVNLDSPVNMPQNFYIYKDDEGRFNPVIWDVNETFGVFRNVTGGPPLSNYDMQHLDPFFNSGNPDYPIVSKVLNIPLYRRIYTAHVKTMMDDLSGNGWYVARALEIQDIIDEEVQNDPNKLYTYDDFINNIYNSVGGGPPPQGQSIIGIAELMGTRITYLNSLQEFQAEAPAISDVTNTPAIIFQGDEVWITANISNTVAVQLGYCSMDQIRFTKTNMFDDGNHNDGAAGDGIYGISITAGNTNIAYYIFADNDEAVSFSPPRAEYEYYTITVMNDVAINEFMADNETTISDQDGEYDDWIELYNNTSGTVSLGGWYLSDDATNPGKWVFPDTVIASGEYLIVWADEDQEQEGLHANFKLSASGEVIMLSDAGLNLMDQINFGIQKTDTTTGRFPNGIGNFIEMIPTFGYENVDSLSGEDEIPVAQTEKPVLKQNYPNPFSRNTTLTFVLPEPANVCLEVFDIFGRKVVIFKGWLEDGEHDYQFNGDQYPSGLYFTLLRTDDSVQQIKMVLAK
jgi:hypothetical protein